MKKIKKTFGDAIEAMANSLTRKSVFPTTKEGIEIVNERPDGMPMEEYRRRRKESTRALRQRVKQSVPVWSSVYHFTEKQLESMQDQGLLSAEQWAALSYSDRLKVFKTPGRTFKGSVRLGLLHRRKPSREHDCKYEK